MPLAFPSFTTALAPVGTGITIAASTWRWDGASGAVRVSSGFPLQPGMLTAANANTLRVFVGSPLVEQAIALKPTDGWFPDGSYRSPGVQFLYNLTHDTPVPAEIRINQGVRGTSDIAWVEPTRVSVMKKAVIAPTDPVHLCKTMVTLTPLTPKVNDTGTDATWGAYAESAYASPAISQGNNPGTAIYDEVNGCWQLYCRTGNRLWYQRAYDWACGFHGEFPIDTFADSVTLMEALLPNSIITRPVASEADWNPEGLTHVVPVGSDPDFGNATEAYGYGRWISLCSSYWMTAYRQFKRLIAINVNAALGGTESGYPTYRDRTSIWYGARYNLRYLWAPVFAGYLTGCTTGLVTPGGYPAVTSWDYATYIPWILNAMEYYIWNLPGDYRNGLVGQRHTTIDPVVSGNPAADMNWGVTNFQLSVMAEDLMLIYDHILPDARIPVWLKTICDYFITQVKPWETGDYQGIPVAYVDSYINLPPAAAASPTFTANTTISNAAMTWTGGNLPTEFFLPGYSFTGPNIQANTFVGSASATPPFTPHSATVPLTDNSLVTARPATATGSGTYRVFEAPYDMVMFAPVFAWYFAYSGTALYNTWATRFSEDVTTMAAMAQRKNWGEVWGGTRQQFLYYRAGGTIRGIPGAHPTVIVNPPVQPTLG